MKYIDITERDAIAHRILDKHHEDEAHQLRMENEALKPPASRMSDQDKARAIACDQLGCHMAYYRDRNAHVFGCDNLTAIVAAALSDVRAQERERCAKIAAQNRPEASLADMAWQSGYDAACATIADAIRASQDNQPET